MQTLAPSSICGRRVIATLAEGNTYLVDDRGRTLVLKKLESDCMLGAQLHPSIRDRLARIRELAHTGVANLHGVERDGDDAYLVWDYVEGVAFDEVAAGASPAEMRRLARDLTLAVEAMHLRGVVHGSLHARNIFIRGDGSLQLTHVSPLLYSEPEYDITAVAGLTGTSGASLAEIRAKLAEPEQVEEARDPAERRFRLRAGLMVIATILLGIAATMAAYRYARSHPAPIVNEEESRP